MDPLIKAFRFWSMRSLPRGRRPNSNDAAAFYVQTRLDKPLALQGLKWQDVHQRLVDAQILTKGPQ